MQDNVTVPDYVASASERAREERDRAAHDTNVVGGGQLLDPKIILPQYDLVHSGDTIADLGVGSMPFFTQQAGKMAGQEGKLFIVDVQKNVLGAAENFLKLAGLRNVIPVWSDLETIGAAKIPDASVDIAFIVNVLFQSAAKDKIVGEAARLLKPGGRLLVIDYKPGLGGFAPKDAVQKQEIIDSAQHVGLMLQNDFSAGEKHWGVIFTKQA